MNEFFHKYGLIIGRAGIGFVFAWFGFSTIFNPAMFAGLVPQWIGAIINPQILVTIHGFVEACAGVLLALGIGSWITPVVLMCTLTPVVFLVRGETQVRDIGILSALILLATRKE